MIEYIEYKGQKYPKWQSEGFASQFVFPFATKVCQGIGVDVGCMKTEWAYPGSIPVDITFNDGYDAMNLPKVGELDYIFSSHCLEHLPNWVDTLDYWYDCLKPEGCLFLYLPDMDAQEYWQPWNNRKHTHYFNSHIFNEYFKKSDKNWSNYIISGTDLNAAFTVIVNK